MNAPTKHHPAFATLGQRIDRRADQPLYRQIARLLRGEIIEGRLKPGQAMVPQRELGQLWDIGEVTIRRAMQELAEEGLIQARAGSGTVVCARQPRGWQAATPGSTLALGVAMADLQDGYPFFAPMLKGLRQCAMTVAVRLFDMPPSEQMSGSLEHVPDLEGFDGLLMMSPVNLGLAALCQQRRIAMVMLFGDLADGYSHCIVPDYARGVSQAVGHLHGGGRKRIALVTAGPERFSTGRWMEAHATALEQHGRKPDPSLVIQAGYQEQHGHQAMQKLLSLKHPPDAVIFASDHMARGGLLASAEAGRRVPEDLAIVGAGNLLGDGGWPVPMTTIDLGLEQMGDLARQAILDVLQGNPSAARRRSVATQLIPGKTS